MNQDNNTNNRNKIIYIIWVVLSVIAFIYLSGYKKEYLWGLMVVGQFIFVNFSKIQKQSKEKTKKTDMISLIFEIVGTLLFFIPLFTLFPEFFSTSVNWENVLSSLIFIIPVMVGTAILIKMIKHQIDITKRCNTFVIAIIDEIVEDKVKGHFEYKGKTYTITANYKTNDTVGKLIDILINPNNPNEYISNLKPLIIIIPLIGVFIILLLSLFSYIFNNPWF